MDLYLNRLATELVPRDRAFAQSLVYTVLRQKQYLDFVIGRFAKHPLRKMKPRTVLTLEVGIAQLLFMDNIPKSAAVNSTIEVLKQMGQPRWLVGFANGLLRNVARERETLPAPEEATDKGEPIVNHPQWLFDKWSHRYGKSEALEICSVNNVEPGLTLRVNTQVISRDELKNRLIHEHFAVTECAASPIGLLFTESPGSVTALPGYEEGAFAVQDESAQLATMLLLGQIQGVDGDGKPKRVLDACAGLGGKTMHLAQALPNSWHIVAVEPDRRRAALLEENFVRLHPELDLEVIPSTLEAFVRRSPEPFDAILLDVPCSGTGVIRRKPDIRWSRKPDDLHTYADQQLALLSTAATLLKPGGRLVYATCSLEPEENEQVIARFLAQNSDFHCCNAREIVPEAAALVDAHGFFHPLPCKERDGFFAAVLEL